MFSKVSNCDFFKSLGNHIKVLQVKIPDSQGLKFQRYIKTKVKHPYSLQNKVLKVHNLQVT